MKKLTSTEINFIDDYLKSSGITFWDVRLEILDHVVINIEKLLNTEQISFNEALIKVHKNFGNCVFYESGISLKEQLYQNNTGYKRLLKNRQKTISKILREAYLDELKSFFQSAKYVIEFILFMVMLVMFYAYNPKISVIIGVAFLLFIEIYKQIKLWRNKGFKNSVFAAPLSSVSSLVISSVYPILELLKYFVGEHVYYFCAAICCGLLFLLSRVSLLVFNKVYTKNSKEFKLYMETIK